MLLYMLDHPHQASWNERIHMYEPRLVSPNVTSSLGHSYSPNGFLLFLIEPSIRDGLIGIFLSVCISLDMQRFRFWCSLLKRIYESLVLCHGLIGAELYLCCLESQVWELQRTPW